MTDQSKIRNFSIIAHIDHGKSTLSDRMIEICGAVEQRQMESQLLDNMDLERERGITIKARAVRMDYKAQDGETYCLNLIDTPGHVDFNYEVSRSLAACEGAVLVVDAAQGVEAQTLANTYLALEHNLEIRPVINKIDLPAADPQRVKQEVEDVIGLPALDAPEISAKMGINVEAVLEDIVRNIPAPIGDPNVPLKALIFDSQYDPYLGVIVYFRVMEGTLKKGMEVRLMASGASYQVLDCGYLRPLGMDSCQALSAGEVGWFTASIKNVKDTRVGDTITGVEQSAAEALPGPRNGIMPVAPDAQGIETLQKCVRRALVGIPGQHHAAHVQIHTPEDVDQPQHVLVIRDAQIAPDLVFLNVRGIDGNDDFHILLELLEHPDLAVRRKARQHPGCVKIIKELAAEFQIQLAAELGDAPLDLFGLGGEVLLIVKSNGCHIATPLLLF